MGSSTKTNNLKSEGKSVPKGYVTREEFIQVMNQVSENIQEMSKYLMQDMNTHFQRYTYPMVMRMDALLELLDQKGTVTKQDVLDLAKKLAEDALKAAQEVKTESAVDETETSTESGTGEE